jgi:diguanylate cyclase (GGDEF)-like protein/PAS domain S-box-containing protein
MATILVVDDRPVNREFLATLLGYVGHSVLQAADGAEALAIVHEQRPDLVITDLMMPTMSGVEFAGRVRNDAQIAATPIIFYTATYRVSEANAVAQECGVATVLVKPVEPQTVLNAVTAALGAGSPVALSPELAARTSESMDATLPAHLRNLTELQRSLRRKLDEAIAQVDAQQTAEPSIARAGINALYPFSLRLAALLELNVALSSERDPQAMQTLFCRNAQNIMNSKYVGLGILDRDRKQLRRVTTRGVAPDVHARLTTMDPWSGVFGQVISSAQPVSVEADGGVPNCGLPAFHPPVRRLLVVPLPVSSAMNASGWLYFADKVSGHAFDLEDERFAVTMAAQFALAFGNLILFEEGEQHARWLETEVAERQRTADALSESESRFRQIAENIDAVFFLIESDSSKAHYVSPPYAAIWGRGCDSFYRDPRSWLEAIHPADRMRIARTLETHAAAGLPFDLEHRLLRGASERWIHLRGFPIHDAAGRPYRTACIATDITEAKRVQGELLESNRRFRDMLDNVELISVMLDAQARLIYCNDHFLRVTGWQRHEIIGKGWFDQVPPQVEVGERKARFDALIAGDPSARHLEREIVTRSGERRLIRLNNSLLHSADGAVIGVASLGEDVTEQRRAQAQLAHAATHDRTTGLPRFGLVEDFLQTACAEAAARDGRVIVLYVDLDRFHTTNETSGRAAGDDVLRTVAVRLSEAMGTRGRVAHVAGDEFALVLKDPGGALDQVEFGDALRARVEEPIDLEGRRVFVTCSIGVSCFPDNGSGPQELLRQAESAMLRAKSEGRNTVVAFSNDHRQELDDRVALGVRLNDALSNAEFLLHYQPRINGQDWRVSGFEALLRWQSPDFGLLAPGRFLQVAEDLGLILEIGSFVLDTACRQVRLWIDAGAEDFSVSINVSPAQMQRPNFVAEVRNVLQKYKLPPHSIELELTESMMTGNIERVTGTMRALKALGVKLSLDDFGTGYSSLNYLRRFPLDTLKIDRSFVHDISTDAGAAGVCRAIITLSHQLGMTVLAEGVETAAQVGYLRRNECDYFQGYYFCKPVTAPRALEMLQHRYLAHEGIEQPAEQQPTLLLVDDEENILNALTRMLRRDGYRILTATNADDALDILGRNEVQVVISDQRMPGISGTELLSKVKEMHPETVRMVLSGYTDLSAVTAAINQGAIYKFLTKPWDDEELRLQVRDAFRIAQRRNDTRKSATP